MKLLRWIDDWAEEACVSIMLAVLVALLGSEVISRFIFNKSFTWIEELSRYLFVWSSYLGISVAIKHKEQLRILMFMNLIEKYSPKLMRICYVISELIFTVFCLIIVYYGISLIENMTRLKQVSAALEIDVKYAYMIIPLSMGLAAFRTLQSLLRDFRRGTLYFESRRD